MAEGLEALLRSAQAALSAVASQRHYPPPKSGAQKKLRPATLRLERVSPEGPRDSSSLSHTWTACRAVQWPCVMLTACCTVPLRSGCTRSALSRRRSR